MQNGEPQNSSRTPSDGAPVPPGDPTITATNETISIPGARVGAGGRSEQIGRYRILRVIGEGGMGTVYEAEQEKPKRIVALKVIKPGYASPQMLKRFDQESQVLGRLQHPGIAQIYEAGVHTFGQSRADTSRERKRADDQYRDSYGAVPYFAMEFIRGRGLKEFMEEAKLGTRPRLELVAKICDAVHHAHQKGVIHRDLKPGNILVDESGQPKILDFGVARATDSDIQAATIQTDVGQLIGTIPYMSPEQVAADPQELDTRSDVYALGVIAYEALAGCLPYDLKHKMIHEAARVIREEEPAPLSTVNRLFRGDVETIVAKSLEKDKTRRYQSAAELASDIRRYLHDEPIVARPASAAYQFKKFAQRHKTVVFGAAAVFAVLVTGVIVSTSLYLRAEHARTATLAAVVQQLLTEAKALEGEQRWQEAEQKYERLLDVDPTHLAVLGDMARMKKEEYNQQTGRGLTPPASLLTDAVQLCDRALAAMPNDKGLWNIKGVLLKKLHRYDEAVVAYQKALELTPEFSAAWENLGIVHALAGDMPGAWRHLRKAAELLGTDKAQCEYPWRNLAAIELHLGKPEALEHVNQALACNRIDPMTLLVRARMFLELPGASDAKKALEDAANADFLANENDPIVKRIRALAYLANNDAENAARCAQAAVDLGDPLPTVDYLVLAVAQAKLGAIDAARDALEKATDLWPPELQEAASYHATAEGGILWFEQADALWQLKEQAVETIRTAP